MAKTKMTVALAKEIANQIMIDSINARAPAIVKAYAEIQAKVFFEIHDPKTVALLETVPANFLRGKTQTVHVYFTNNDRMLIHFSDRPVIGVGQEGLVESVYTALREIPNVYGKGVLLTESPYERYKFKASDELKELIKQFYDKYNDICTYMGVKGAIVKIIGALRAFTYVEDLQTAWPEAWPQADRVLRYSHAPSKSTNLPATSIHELNAQLGLPT